ncbi:MAG: protease modulator HflC [Candidatus Euphemobacter frigidus]|nr:protease modulator HflC [Candidatus Euphemobacter frigidus]MDP8274965.1 protease modulator HflC [Candidatus Euphemobacter frigidus]
MKNFVLLLVVLGILICLVVLSVFTVNEKEIVIVTRFGSPVRTVQETGLHRKLPGFIDKVNRLDKRIHVFKPRPIQLLLKEQKPIIMTCYVCWQINDPLVFFQSLGTSAIAEAKLGDMVNARLGNVLGDYSIDQIINTNPEKVKLAQIEERILNECNEQAREQYGLKVVDLGVRRITYPTIVTEAVYNRMKSDREKEAKKYRAEGGKKAAEIEAEADRKAKEILARATRDAEIIKGEGDKEAIKTRGEAYSQAPELFEFLDSLDTYRRILGRDTTLILSLDSDLFRYLLPGEQDIKPASRSTSSGDKNKK